MALDVTPGVGETLKSRLDTGEHVISHDVERINGVAPTLGAGAIAAGTPRVTLASDDPAVAAIGTTNTNLGASADAAVAAGATGSLHAKMRRVTQGLEDLKAGITALPLPTGAASAANQATIIGHIDTVETVLGLIEANTDGTETQTTESNARLGATNESSAAADNSTSGLNGLVKRLLARLTALLPAALTAGGGIKAGLVDALPAGTALIGKVGIDQTTPGTTNRVDLGAAIPAGTNLIGSAAAGAVTGIVYSGTTPLTIKYAKIGCASSGENTLVAAVTSKKIRVLGIFLVNAAGASAVNIYFKDGAGGSAICGDATYQIPLDRTGAAGSGGFSRAFSPGGHFESASGAALILNLSAAAGVAGDLAYIEV